MPAAHRRLSPLIAALVVGVVLPPWPAAAAESVVLLPLAAAGLGRDVRAALDVAVRRAAGARLPGGWHLLPEAAAGGRTIPDGCGGRPRCVVQTLRAVGADWGVGVDVVRLGSTLRLSLSLYEARSGVALRAAEFAALDREGIVAQLPGACASLFATRSVAAIERSDDSEPDFVFLRLEDLARNAAPEELDATVPVGGLGEDDLAALEAYDETVRHDAGSAEPEAKARRWRQLASQAPRFAKLGAQRAAEWEAYGAARRRAADARKGRAEARDRDWRLLSRLLKLSVVSVEDKRRWVDGFLDAYGDKPRDNPYVTRLRKMMDAIDPYGPIDGPYGPIDSP